MGNGRTSLQETEVYRTNLSLAVLQGDCLRRSHPSRPLHRSHEADRHVDTRIENNPSGHDVHSDEQEHEEPLAEAPGKAWRRRRSLLLLVQLLGEGATTLFGVVEDGQEVVDVVEPVGADATGGGPEVARDAEGVALAEQVRERYGDRHQPRYEYDPTRAGLGGEGLGAQRQNDGHEPIKRQIKQKLDFRLRFGLL